MSNGQAPRSPRFSIGGEGGGGGGPKILVLTHVLCSGY